MKSYTFYLLASIIKCIHCCNQGAAVLGQADGQGQTGAQSALPTAAMPQAQAPVAPAAAPARAGHSAAAAPPLHAAPARVCDVTAAARLAEPHARHLRRLRGAQGKRVAAFN